MIHGRNWSAHSSSWSLNGVLAILDTHPGKQQRPSASDTAHTNITALQNGSTKAFSGTVRVAGNVFVRQEASPEAILVGRRGSEHCEGYELRCLLDRFSLKYAI